jgi:hypothetical protein
VHQLKVAYYEHGGGARIHFWWEPTSTPASPTGPPAPVTPTAPTAVALGPWQGEYFNNRGLAGAPVLVRSDAAVDFNWGWGTPAPQVIADDFSARWSGSFPFEGGRYTFTTYSDDGVRLYVDGRRVVDSWRPMRGYRSATLDLAQGVHSVQVEFFERSGVAVIRLWVRQTGRSVVPAPVPPIAVPSPTPSPAPRPAACLGGPLQIEAWPASTTCLSGGRWAATIHVRGYGGDCRYVYAWDGQTKGGPTSGSLTFELRSATRGAMVGTASVTSAGQMAKTGLYVRLPADCD